MSLSLGKSLVLASLALALTGAALPAHADSSFSISYNDGGRERGHHDRHHGRGHGYGHGYGHDFRHERWHHWDRPYHSSTSIIYISPLARTHPILYGAPPVVERQIIYQPQPIVEEVSDEPYCREYQSTVRVGNRTQQAYGTACMQPDGSWKRVK